MEKVSETWAGRIVVTPTSNLLKDLLLALDLARSVVVVTTATTDDADVAVHFESDELESDCIKKKNLNTAHKREKMNTEWYIEN